MTTVDATLGNAVKMRLASYLVKSAERSEQMKRARTWMQSLVRLVLSVGGYSCLTYSGFLWDMRVGFVVAGLSCFALSAQLTSNRTNTPPSAQRMR